MQAPEKTATKRLVLRRPVGADVPAIFSGWASSPKATRYMAWPRHETLEDTRAFIEFSDGEWESNGVGPYIVELAETGEIIGSTGLSITGDGVAGVGYIFSEKYWNRGFATEALQACIAIAKDLGLRELQAPIYKENYASRRVVGHCRFGTGGVEIRKGMFPNLDLEVEEVVVYRLSLEG